MKNLDYVLVVVPDEIDALCEFDRRAFAAYPADLFSPADWMQFESYWMKLDGRVVGCAAFEPNGDELWIASTGIDPEYRRQGLGRAFKKWQIEFAKAHGYARLATVIRESNAPMLALNRELGFTLRTIAPNFYSDPEENGVVMELRLRDAQENVSPSTSQRT